MLVRINVSEVKGTEVCGIREELFQNFDAAFEAKLDLVVDSTQLPVLASNARVLLTDINSDQFPVSWECLSETERRVSCEDSEFDSLFST